MKLEWKKYYLYFHQPLAENWHFLSLEMLTRNCSILKVLMILSLAKFTDIFISFYSFTYTLTSIHHYFEIKFSRLSLNLTI